MAAVETIKIKIDVDADSAKIKKLTRDIERLKRAGGSNSSLGSGKTPKGKKEPETFTLAQRLAKEKTLYKRHFDYLDKGQRMAGGFLRKFLGVALKGIIAEMALLGAAMIAVHALFVTGKFLGKAYSGAMQIAAQGIAALATAAAVAAAAVREQQAAMYAYRGKGAAEFGAGINQARVAMRALQMDQDLAGLGAANLNKAYAAMSKTMSTPQINASTKMFKNLMDFGSAGQDPGAAAEKVGKVIEAITGAGKGKDKKSLAQTISLIKELGPEAAAALKKANVTTKAELTKLINSGEFAKLGGVFGQFDTTNNTLIGRMKGFFALIKGQFADFGQQFLGPANEAMQKIFHIISREVRKILSVSSDFATGSFLDGLVSVIDKVASFFGNTLQKWLPKAENQFKNIGNWWTNLIRTMKIFRENLRPLIDGARVIEEALKPVFKALFENGKKNLQSFRKELLENKDEVLKFGEGIAKFINATGEFAIKLKEAFFDILPILNSALSGITDIFKMLTGIMTLGSGGGAMKSLLPLLGMFFLSGKMKNANGMMMANNKGMAGALLSQPIQAQQVIINSPSVRGPGGAPIGGPTSGPGTAPPGTPGAPVPGTPGSPGGPPRSPAVSQGPLHGPPAYTNQGQPLYGGVNGGKGTGKLVGRDPVTGRFVKLQPGTGDVGVAGPHAAAIRAQGQLSSGATPAPVPGTPGSPGGPVVMPGSSPTSPAGAAPINFGNKAGGALPAVHNVPGAPQYLMTKNGLTPNYQGINPGRGMMAPKIDDQGNMSQVVRPSRANIDALNKQAGQYATGGTNQPGGKPMKYSRRAEMRYLRNETRAAQAVQKANNSASVKMGATMALGAMAAHGPEEMRGAMGLGAGLAMVNPMLGLSVAGIGGAMKAKGAGKGAMAGMAGGAALGTMIGGPGMGTAIGAAIGLVGGGIMGGINDMRDKAKQAGAAAKDALGGIFTEILKTRYRDFEKSQQILAEGGDTSKIKGSFLNLGGSLSTRASKLADEARAALTENRFGLNAVQGNIQNSKLAGMMGRVPGIGTIIGGDAGMVAETGTNNYEASVEGFGNSFIDLANSSITNPMQAISSVMGAMVPDIMNVGALIGKIPGAEKVGSLFNTGIGKGIKAALGFNVKSSRRNKEEEFIKKLQKDGLLTEEAVKDAMKDPGAFVNTFQKEYEEKTAAFKQIDDVNEKRLDALMKMSGKSAPELEALAKNLGVNLYDASIKFDDMVTKLKINMVKSAAEMKAANQNTFLDVGGYQSEIKKQETTYAVNDKTRILADKFAAGQLSAGDVDVYKYLEGLNADMLALHGGNAIAAFYDQQQMIGKGGSAYTDGGSLEGMEGIIAGDAKFQEQQAKVMKGFSQTGAEQITAMFGGEDMAVAGGSAAIQRQIMGMTDKTMQQKLLTDLEKGQLQGMTFDKEGKSTGLSIEAALAGYGISAKGEKLNTDPLDAVADGIVDGSKAFKDAVDSFVKQTNEVFKNSPMSEKPEWFTKEAMKEIMGSDTSTPRGGGIGDTTSSRLSQTMSRHAAMNSQLTGKRTITSGYRTTSLGSINSDHVMGRAIDLTGQNLGQYAKLVHSNGGFAEFHGRGASRHLHTVPGPGAAIGETSTPKANKPVTITTGSGQSSASYTVNVYGAQGQSVNDLANAVMAKIKDSERTHRERA